MNSLQRVTPYLSHLGRQFSTTYAVCSGGGSKGQTISRLWKQNLPDWPEYTDIGSLSRYLVQANYVPKENLSVFFGNGETSPKIRTNSLFNTILKRFNGVDSSMSTTGLEFPMYRGAALLPLIEAEFHFLSEKITAQDRLIIIISSHGHRKKGIILWNEYFSRNFLSPDILKCLLDKFKEKPQINLFISSCYSGLYLPLTSRNVSVICTSSKRKLSSYNGFRGCEHLQHLFGCNIQDFISFHLRNNLRSEATTETPHDIFFNSVKLSSEYSQKSIFQIHKLRAQHGNFYATESLSYFVHQNLENKTKQGLLGRTLRKIQYKLDNSRINFGLAVDSSLVTFVLLDPTGIFETIAATKTGLFLGKTALPFFKLMASVAMPNLTRYVTEQIRKTETYHHWFTSADRRLLRKVRLLNPKSSKKSRRLSSVTRKKIRSILTEFANLKNEATQSQHPPLLHYDYLHEKVSLFLKLASPEEITEFLTHYDNLSQIKIKTIPPAICTPVATIK